MNYLFSKNSLLILESLTFIRTLYAFDYDGTLAPITRRPGDAEMSSTTASLLTQLIAVAPVAIVSGRSIADLRTRVPAAIPYLIGNHGLEGLGKANGSLEGAKSATEKWSAKFQQAVFEPGVELEDKTYSLAVHYRRSTNKKIAKKKIQDFVAELEPSPRIITGKSVVNLLPEGAPHKGVALRELLSRECLTHAFYVGDDETDEDVFSLNDENIMTIRVGYKKASQAKYYVDRQSDLNRVLRHLIQFHKRSHEKS